MYRANVIKFMIASPNDVDTARQVARDVLKDWNVVHSEDKGVVLMPVGWDTHVTPEMGDRPQAIINKQILLDCDVLVAIFWTRLGSPTGAAPSGTVEEIEEHLQAGKPAMIYFSSAPVRPESVEEGQYQALREFRAKCQQRGIIETFESVTEFREKFSRQLAQLVIAKFASGTKDEAIAFAFKEVERVKNPVAASLSARARQLLLAATDADGVIMRLQTLEGLGIQANGRQFAQRGNPRSEAEWDSALQELRDLDLIKDMGKGEVFRVTQKGYEIADLLRGGAGDSDVWRELETKFRAMSGKGIRAIYNKASPNPWIITGRDGEFESEFKTLSELASKELDRFEATRSRLSFEAISSTGMVRWFHLLWQEGELKDDASVMYPSDALPTTGVIENLAETSARQCLRLRSVEPPSYTFRDWQTIATEIAAVNENMAWVGWTKRPAATGIRKWDVMGEQARTLRPLLERAGQMLKKSGLNNEVSILLLLEKDALKRWCEYVSGSGELRVDGRGYEQDVQHVSGRLLDAVQKSVDACSEIVVKLT